MMYSSLSPVDFPVSSVMMLKEYIRLNKNYLLDVANEAWEEEKKPLLEINRKGESVTIFFDKKQMEGLIIFSRRNEEKYFSFLAVTTQNTYTDNRSVYNFSKETREYRVYYMKGNISVGHAAEMRVDWSDCNHC